MRFPATGFDGSGARRFDFECGPTTVAAGGERTVIGVANDDHVTSRLRLLDAGREVAARDVPSFREAAFSTDGSALVLAGKDSLQWLDAGTGDLLAASSASLDPAPGNPVAFGRDGSRVLLVARTADPEGVLGPYELMAVSRTGRDLSLRVVAPLEGEPVVVGLEDLDTGIRLATREGVRVVTEDGR